MSNEKIEAIEGYLRLIRKSFECTICIDYYENPYKTNCGHIFCKKCISDYFKGKKSALKCPLCNTEIQIRSLKKFTSMSEYVSSAKNLERVALSEISQIKTAGLCETTNTIKPSRLVEKKKLSDKTNDNVTTTSTTTTAAVVSQPSKQMKRKPSNSTAIDLDRNKKQKKLNENNKENNSPVVDQQSKPTTTTTTSKTPKTNGRVLSTLNKVTNHKESVDMSSNNEPTSQGIEFVAPQVPPSSSSTAVVEDTILHDPHVVLDQAQNTITTTTTTTTGADGALLSRKERFPATSHLRKDFQLKTIAPLKFKKDETGNHHFKSKTESSVLNNNKDSLLTTPRNFKQPHQTSRSAPAKPQAAAVYNNNNNNNQQVMNDYDEPLPPPPPPDNILFERVENHSGVRDLVKFRLAGRLTEQKSQLVNQTTLPVQQSSRPVVVATSEASTSTDDLNNQEKLCSIKTSTSSSVAVQTDHLEAFFHTHNIDSILDKIVGFVYTDLEYSATNEFVNRRTKSDRVVSTPPPPPPQPSRPVALPLQPPPSDVTIIPDSPESSDTHSNVTKSFAFDNRELNSSRNSRKQLDFVPSNHQYSTTVHQIDHTKTPNNKVGVEEIIIDSPSRESRSSHWNSQQVEDSPPSQLDATLSKMISRAECVNAAKIVHENSMLRLDLSTSLLMNKSATAAADKTMNESVVEAPPPPPPPPLKLPVNIGPLIITDTMTPIEPEIKPGGGDNLIITDTMPLIDHHQLVEQKALIISDTVNNQTTSESQMDKSFKSTINPSLAPTLILNESISAASSTSPPPKPQIKRVAAPGLTRMSNTRRHANQSALLDSIDEIMDDNTSLLASNLGGGPLELTSIVSSKHDTTTNMMRGPPPAASAILGESMMLMNQSIANRSVYSAPPPVPLFDQHQTSVIVTTNRREDQNNEMVVDVARDSMFTDSNLMLVDNICQEMYADQNCSIVDLKTLTSGEKANARNTNQYEFACSLLEPNMKTMLIKFAQSMNVNFVNDITPATTHLIVNPSTPDLLCDVTSKYLKAISRKIWIVSIKWIVKCLNQGQLVKPDEFEVRGDKVLGGHEAPRRARSSSPHRPFFDNYEFMFVGEYGNQMISKSEIIQLAALNGARVRQTAREFSETSNTIRVIVFDDAIRRFSSKDALTLLNNQVMCVNKSWLLDSLASLTLRPMDPYQTYDHES